MPQLTLIRPTTDAETTKRAFNTVPYSSIALSADALAGAEVVPVFVAAGAVWVTATDASGTAIELSATMPVVTLPPGPQYAITKPATAGACGVYVDLGHDAG